MQCTIILPILACDLANYLQCMQSIACIIIIDFANTLVELVFTGPVFLAV